MEKLPSGEDFDLAVRDGKTGFTFFNIEGHQDDYDANAQWLSITGGRLLISNDFANVARAANRRRCARWTKSPSEWRCSRLRSRSSSTANVRSVVMPPLQQPADGETPTLVPGPDVIVGDLPSRWSKDRGTSQCNLRWAGYGNRLLVITDDLASGLVCVAKNRPSGYPAEFLSMSGGATNDERLEQIGQSWLKHAFTAHWKTMSAVMAATPVAGLQAPICARVAPILTASV